MKRILSIVLALVMLISSAALTSCSKPQEKIEKAELVFDETSYSVTMNASFSSSDSELNALLAAKASSVPITVDNESTFEGNKVTALKIEVEKNPIGTVSPVVFTIVDKALFLDEGMLKNDSKVQVLVANSDKIKLLDSFNARFVVDETFFEDCDVEKDGKKRIYNFSGVSEDGKIELKYALRRVLLGIYDDYSLELTDCSYSITLSNNKYEKAVLSYTHNVTVDGKTFSVTVNMVADYSYDNIPRITAPSGVYERKTFEEFF